MIGSNDMEPAFAEVCLTNKELMAKDAKRYKSMLTMANVYPEDTPRKITFILDFIGLAHSNHLICHIVSQYNSGIYL